MLLQDKTIIITGGSTGIGRATALKCAQEGAHIALADINLAQGQQTCDEIERLGRKALLIETDVTDTNSVQHMIEETVSSFGSFEGAFNNAGIEGKFANITKITEDEFDKTMAVDLKGVWLCVKYQLAYFSARGKGGSIVNTASVAGLVGTRGGSAYSGAKHGVIGITKSVALEFAHKNIRVNAVCPGVIDTSMVDRMSEDTGIKKEQFVSQEPIGRLGEAKEVAQAVAWLLSEQASYVTGAAMPVDGGYTAI